jgi:alkylation response protein AidB-like acyl-CoA dehydrogenase
MFGATTPADYEGLDLSSKTYEKVIKWIASMWDVADWRHQIATRLAACVTKNGTEAQNPKYLQKFARGLIRGRMAPTEQGFTADLQGIRQRVVRDGDHCVVNGTKAWITNSAHNSCFPLFVKTGPEAGPQPKGLPMFIVEEVPGFTVSKKLGRLVPRAWNRQSSPSRVAACRWNTCSTGRKSKTCRLPFPFLTSAITTSPAVAVGWLAQRLLRYAQQPQTFGKPFA